jgi:hypothetical protein
MGGVVQDRRPKHHQYFAKYQLSFAVGDYQIEATRYGEVFYRTGSDSFGRRECTAQNQNCWFTVDHFFIGLPNRDIISVYMTTRAFELREMAPGGTFLARGYVADIFRDQPDRPTAKEFGPCSGLTPVDLAANYNIHRTREGAVTDAVLEIHVERLPRRPPRVDDDDAFSRQRILWNVSCTSLARQNSRDQTVRQRVKALH